MILDPRLSYKKADETEIEEETEAEQDRTTSVSETVAFPVEALSERYMKTLHRGAQRGTNVPAAGLAALQRHFRDRDQDTDGADASGESVGE